MPNYKKDVGVVYRSDVKPRVPIKTVNGFLQRDVVSQVLLLPGEVVTAL